MENKVYFKCTKETIKMLFDMFDTLMEADSTFRKNILNDKVCRVDMKERSIGLKAKMEGTDEIFEIKNIKEIHFTKDYMLKASDMIRACNYYGIKGSYNKDTGVSYIYEPHCGISHFAVCEFREKYKKFDKKKFKKFALPNSFKEMIKTNEYREFLKAQIRDEHTIGMIFEEKDSTIQCGFDLFSTNDIDSLQGVEKRFFNELLKCVLDIEVPVSWIYFYNDLNWTEMLIVPSEIKNGEYEVVVK